MFSLKPYIFGRLGKLGPINSFMIANKWCSNHFPGRYIYTESSGRRPNDTARFVSPQMTIDNTGSCIKFWYSMYGSDINRLNLYAMMSESRTILCNFGEGECIFLIFCQLSTTKSSMRIMYQIKFWIELPLNELSDGNLGPVIWRKIGNQGAQWKFASVFINLASFTPPQSSPTSIQVKTNTYLHFTYRSIWQRFLKLAWIIVLCVLISKYT